MLMLCGASQCISPEVRTDGMERKMKELVLATRGPKIPRHNLVTWLRTYLHHCRGQRLPLSIYKYTVSCRSNVR